MPLLPVGTDFEWTKYLSEHSSTPAPKEAFSMVCLTISLG